MMFLWVLVPTVVLTVLLKKPIKKYPALFYAIAIAADVLFICNSYVSFPRPVSSALFVLVHKCTLSLALFTVVMYIGVFAQGSKAKTYLLPIRAELSIVAWILSLGHMAVYLMSYVPQLSHGAQRQGCSAGERCGVLGCIRRLHRAAAVSGCEGRTIAIT